MGRSNPYIEFIKAHKGSGLSRDQLVDKYYASKANQMGGDLDREELRELWKYINGRIGMTSEDDPYREQFIDDLLVAAAGRPLTKTMVTIAHAMWHGDGVILPDIFSEDKKKQLAAINSSSGGTGYPSIIAFVMDYLDQMKY